MRIKQKSTFAVVSGYPSVVCVLSRIVVRSPLSPGTPVTKAETPLVKKRQTKKKKNDSASKKDGKGGGSGGGEDGDDSDGYEFVIVSYDNKVCH